jgi:hypothetical protein
MRGDKMERGYKVFHPKHVNWCVPAALQTVLNSRGINVTQEEIAKAKYFPRFLREGSSFEEFEFNEALLEGFLSYYGLRGKFHNPFTDFSMNGHIEEFLSGIREDNVLVAYNPMLEEDRSSKSTGHLAVFESVPGPGIVRIVDPVTTFKDISLPRLLNNMHSDVNKHFGFYVVSDMYRKVTYVTSLTEK